MKYLLVGRSGSGKDYTSEVLKKYGLTFLKSYTTRPKRFEKEDTHVFINKEEVDSYTDKIAYTKINDNEYFSTKQQVVDNDAYIIDPNGIKVLLDNMKDTEFFIIYVSANNDMQRKQMSINRSNSIEKESVIFDNRNNDENNQFTEFEDKIKDEATIKNRFPFNVKGVYVIHNDYNEITIENAVKSIMSMKL